MEFQYKRITERDKKYEWNDFDNTSYASLYVRLQDIENKIEDGYILMIDFKPGDRAYFANIFRYTPNVQEVEVVGVGFSEGKIAYKCEGGSFFFKQENETFNLFFRTKEEAQKRIEKFKREKK